MKKETKQIISNSCLFIGIALSYYFLIKYTVYHVGIDNVLRPICFLSFGIGLMTMKDERNG